MNLLMRSLGFVFSFPQKTFRIIYQPIYRINHRALYGYAKVGSVRVLRGKAAQPTDEEDDDDDGSASAIAEGTKFETESDLSSSEDMGSDVSESSSESEDLWEEDSLTELLSQ